MLLALVGGFAALGADSVRALEATLLERGRLNPFDAMAGSLRYADVYGEGDFAYIGSFEGSGVGIIDISNPERPLLAAVYDPPTGGRFQDLKVEGGIGYFASEDGGGLHIVDLSDPTRPALLSQLGSSQFGYDDIHNVFVADGYLYEADDLTPTVKVLDVRDPASPFFVRDLVTPDLAFIHDVTVVAGRLYASGWGGFTHIYDVTDIGSAIPRFLGSVPTGMNSHSSAITSDGTLLISSQEIEGGDLVIFDVSDPNVPILLARLDAASLGISAFQPHNPFLFSDTLLFVSWYDAGGLAIDISNPSAPVLVGMFETTTSSVFPSGNFGVYPLLGLDRVLVSDLDEGLYVVDAKAVLCGDVDDDGTLGQADVLAYRRELADPVGNSLPPLGESKCNVRGMTGMCDILDLTILRRTVEGAGLMPPISPVCESITGPDLTP